MPVASRNGCKLYDFNSGRLEKFLQFSTTCSIGNTLSLHIGALKCGAFVQRENSGCGSVWLERSVRDAEAEGSNPFIPTIFIGNYCKTSRLSSDSLSFFVTFAWLCDTLNNRFCPTPTPLYHKIVTIQHSHRLISFVTICQTSLPFFLNTLISEVKKFKNSFPVIPRNYKEIRFFLCPKWHLEASSFTK